MRLRTDAQNIEVQRRPEVPSTIEDGLRELNLLVDGRTKRFFIPVSARSHQYERLRSHFEEYFHISHGQFGLGGLNHVPTTLWGQVQGPGKGNTFKRAQVAMDITDQTGGLFTTLLIWTFVSRPA